MTATIYPFPVNPAQAAPGRQVAAAIETARAFRSSGEQAKRDGRELSPADLDALWGRAAASSSLLPPAS